MFDAPQTPGVPGGPGNPINVLLDLELDVFNQIDTTSYAVFGETSIELTSKLSAFVGGRYTLDDKEYFLEHIRLNAGVPIIPATTVEDDFSAFSGRVGLEYAWTDTVFLYGSASRGFKSGGFNGRPTSSAEISSFDPEFLTTIEAGVKSDLFNDRLRLNVAGFYSFYDDIQLQVRTLDEQSGTFVEVIANAGEARIGGLEVQGTFAPTQSLLFNGNLSYLHDEYRDIGSAGAVGVQEDNELPRSPAITAGFGGQYTAPFFGFGEITFRADYFYKGEYFQDTINTEAIKEDGYSLVNARVSWLSPDERWNVAAFGTNIFDAEYIENGGSALDSFGTAELVPGRPAEWGLTLGFRF
jgi:iron complex outermembrane receptor protein